MTISDQIDRLRAEVADLEARLDTAWGDVSVMQGILARVTAERDEARRWDCLHDNNKETKT